MVLFWKSRIACLRFLLIGLLTGLLLLFLLDWFYPLKLPDDKRYFSQIVVDRTGEPLRAFADERGIWRQQVSLDDVSPLYLEALTQYEDRWFRYHLGVNPLSLLRAFWQNARCGCVVSGGSTLTMQVARRFHPHQKNVFGKFKQALRAFQLEWHLSKDEIITLYLNYVPFGGTVEGVQSASYAYLEKPVKSLTHAEAALLAVLPQAPSRMRPDRHPERAEAARNKVLNRLVAQGVWSAKTVRAAKKESVFVQRPQRPQWAPLLSRRLKKLYPKRSVIHTTIDFSLQQYIQERLSEWIYTQPKHSSAAVLVVDNTSRSVVAYVGSADFKSKQRFGHVDMVQAIRSPGSTLKPFIYAMGIEDGLIHSHSLLSDAPRHYSQYRPENFGREFTGPVTTTHALQKSLNVPAVQVLSHVGADNFHSRMENAGLGLQLPPLAKPNVSMALGGVGVNLWTLVKGYASLVNNGQVSEMQLVLGDEEHATVKSRYLMHPDVAWTTYAMLADRSRPDRTSSRFLKKESRYLAWKTGTSYGYRDAWAVGVSQQYTIGVWLGRPDGTPQPGHFGAMNAAPKLFQIADAIHKNKHFIPKPDSVEETSICWPLGLRESMTKSSFCHKKHTAYLFKGITPNTWDETKQVQWLDNPLKLWLSKDKKHWVDQSCKGVTMEAKTVALWPSIVEPWVPKRWKRRTQIPPVDARCKEAPLVGINDLSIVRLSSGSVFQSVRKQQTLPSVILQSVGGVGARDWFVNGRHVGRVNHTEGLSYTFEKIGQQQVVVLDSAGNLDEVIVHVQQGL